MSSGAFALYIDQAAGGGPGAVVRRVVPLPPTFGGGAIKFNHGWHIDLVLSHSTCWKS